MAGSPDIKRLFVANRGEIAVRVLRTAQRLGVETVLGVSDADRKTLGAELADRTVCIGPARSAHSYLNMPTIVAAAVGTGCDAVHPGYGFLSERAEFQSLCASHGLRFVGPSADAIAQMGDKLTARALARSLDIPVLSGSDHVSSAEQAEKVGAEIGYPFLLKAKAGGGGRGMRVVATAREVRDAFDNARREAETAFGDGGLFIERYVQNARHIEVQILGDGRGNIVHLGDRDCTIQRRHQKLVEEAQSIVLTPTRRREMVDAATKLAKSIAYASAGTVEFVFDLDTDRFYFLEVNARIQVEHPVTEMISGIDIVEEQLRVAGGAGLSISQDDVELTGHAIECRVNAEIAEQNFMPCPGSITHWKPPEGEGIRVDSHCYSGYQIPPYYDSMIAKLIVWALDRESAIERMRAALGAFHIGGIQTTLAFHRSLFCHDDFIHNRVTTTWLQDRVLADN